ncbi:MAG: hypothetical protein NWF05_03580 [Candidatus Bathyarchaeota archaeon]|nr:hypothetical protein [Candidatus Bathyarchaeota archaeon]
MNVVKEKSWSVRLVDGYILNSQVRAERCKGCESTTKLIAGNNSDPDLILYGCNGHKCKHILIRTKVSKAEQKTATPPEITVSAIAELQEISRTV